MELWKSEDYMIATLGNFIDAVGMVKESLSKITGKVGSRDYERIVGLMG